LLFFDFVLLSFLLLCLCLLRRRRPSLDELELELQLELDVELDEDEDDVLLLLPLDELFDRERDDALLCDDFLLRRWRPASSLCRRSPPRSPARSCTCAAFDASSACSSRGRAHFRSITAHIT